MTPNKAFRKFGQAALRAPPGAQLTVGLVWIEGKSWLVMMNIHESLLHLGPKEALGLADIYDKQHQAPEWRGKATGLEWVAPELRKLAKEADEKNRAGTLPPEILEHVAPHGHS